MLNCYKASNPQRMTDKYILNEAGEPVEEPSLLKWGKWMGNERGIVKKEEVGDSKVSTVFLGLNHNFGDGEPILWETMVFGGKLDQEMDRCAGVRADALSMHERMVAKVKEAA